MLERIINDNNLTVFQKAYEIAGFRERFAMEHGSRRTYWSNGRKFIKFTYPESVPYQDANGATYCVTTGSWIA